MTVFVVLPVHNRIDMTLEFLDSLEAQAIEDPIEVVLIDDGSTDGSTQRVCRRPHRYPVHVLQGNGRLWWSGSVWKAMKWLRPKVSPRDWMFLANNDAILEPNCLKYLLETASAHPGSLVGGRSFEVWPDGTRYPVSSGFNFDTQTLRVNAIDGSKRGIFEVQALAGRGLLIPGSALPEVRMHPHLMPQHFADIALTSALRGKGRCLLVDHRAESTQIDRAGSAVELGENRRPSWNRRSALYIPGLVTFWWQQFPANKRTVLAFRLSRIAIQGR